MPDVNINVWAVLVAALINMVIGSLWYMPMLFGKEWSKLVGRKLEDMSGGGTGYAVAGVGALVESYILAHFVAYAGATTAADGAITGFWLWLGFVAITMAINTVFAGSSWKLWKINAGYFLVTLLIQGAVLAVWH